MTEELNKRPNRCCPIGHADFSWTSETKGFGHLTFYVRNGVIFCDNESMDREFIKQNLCDMVDEIVLNQPPTDK